MGLFVKFQNLFKKVFGKTVKHSIMKNAAFEKIVVFEKSQFLMPDMNSILPSCRDSFKAYSAKMPEFCVNVIKDAICNTDFEEVYDKNAKLIMDCTSQKRNPKRNSSPLELNNVEYIKGKVANLCLSGLENNYYHWLIECLGRLYLIKKSGIEPDFYLVANLLPFQKRCLELLKIDERQIISTNQNKLIQAQEMIVPTFINNWELCYVRSAVQYLKQWLPSWIGDLYKEEIMPQIAKGENKRIYISRKNAKQRNLLNESELVPILKKYDFKIYSLEDIDFLDQVKLFKGAQYIIGLHGAGLTNMLFSAQNTKILEIYTQYYKDSSYRILATVLGLDYTYIVGKTTDISKDPKQEDVLINVEDFESAIVKFLGEEVKS